MKLDNQGFGEAVRSLAQRAGMQPYHLQRRWKKRKGVTKNSKTFWNFFSTCELDLQSEYKSSHLKYLTDRGLSKIQFKILKLVLWR